MAEVFKAKSYGVEGFEKIIAIKRILPTMGEDRDFIKMFIDEAKIAGQLAHANICQIFELGRIDGSHFIAMEYIWGKDLLQIQNRLRKIKQQMPVAMACFSIAKVLEGLDYAHRKRDPMGRPLEIVHRDCSPQNVLVSYEGEVKVIDFGIAKATSRNSRTMAGVLKGKFGYMSPEQVRGLPLDRRSDIFALGTMLYECLTGDRLFQGETDFSTLEKVRNVDIRPPRELNPEIPLAVEAVIVMALAKDVDERYQWCSEMLADLQAFLMSQDVVFTAKTLSSWLKEVFAAEIDRERQQLEQYKRVGRDGLFAGVPAAEAKASVVENLGEAGPVEGDPTILGGPSFEEMEAAAAAGAAPAPAEVGPAPGSPAARGAPLDDDDPEAFGEEAPTEIFGEIDHGANPIAALLAASARNQPATVPHTRPPKPPPRQPTPRPDSAQPVAVAPSAPATYPSQPPPPPALPASAAPPVPSPPGLVVPSYANLASPGAAYPQFGQPVPRQGFGPNPGGSPGQPHASSQPIALGTPSAMTAAANAAAVNLPSNSAGQPNQGRTLLGQPPPAGLPSFLQGHSAPFPPYGNPPPQQPPSAPPAPTGPQLLSSPGTQPSYPEPSNPYGGSPQPHPYALASAPYPDPSYGPPPGQGAPYGGAPAKYPATGPAVEPSLDGRRRSSIVRDVAIGVAIAALVLGGFLAVKFLIIDGGVAAPPVAPPSAIATIRLALAPGVSADLFVDDKKVATVGDKQEIPVTAGQRKVKLLGPNGSGCEQDMQLVAGKTTTLDCAMAPAAMPGSAAGSDAVDPAGAGSAAMSGSGSAADAAAVAAAGTREPGSVAPASPAPDKADKPVSAVAQTHDRPDRASSDDRPRASDKRPRAAAADDDLGSLAGGSKPLAPRAEPPARSASRQPAEGRSFLNITSKPNAKILLDNNDTHLTTPISSHALPVPPGKHKLTFVVGGDKFTYSVVVKPGETVTVHKDLQ